MGGSEDPIQRRSDLTLVIRMDASNVGVQDYFLVPTPYLPLSKDRKKLRISDRVFGQFEHRSFRAVLNALHARLDTRSSGDEASQPV